MIRNKVVPVRFPFDDLATTKARPAVCLTEAVGPHRHVVLAFITSRIPTEPLETDVVLDSNQPDFPATGLRVFFNPSTPSLNDDHDYANLAGLRRADFQHADLGSREAQETLRSDLSGNRSNNEDLAICLSSTSWWKNTPVAM